MMRLPRNLATVLALTAALGCFGYTSAASASCGDGVVEATEGCDDGNLMGSDGCSATCAVEAGYGCVPSLFATGVNDAGAALPALTPDPHWTWATTNDESMGVPGIAGRHPAWTTHPPGQWVSPSAIFGNELTTQPNTFWFQRVEIPAAFAGALAFPIVVACDNSCEVFVNGTSYGTHNTFTSVGSVSIPAGAFVAGSNLVTVRLFEEGPGTPRGILIYPGGGGILSQCTEQCANDTECDDSNDCTTDVCLVGACTNMAQAAGSSCSGGVCNGDTLAPMCVGCLTPGDCSDGNSCTQDLCTANTCSNPPVAVGTTCTGGVCSGVAPALCEVCVDSGPGVDSGCNILTPNCIGASGARSCVACLTGAHCDDGVACTTDACVLNVCVNTAVAVGGAGSCSGGEVCSGAPANVCVTCTDTSAAGTDAGCGAGAPHCRTTGNGAPVCEPCLNTDSGSGTDQGCSAGTPYCVSSGGVNSCRECLSPADCSDGNACTQDLCMGGACSNPPESVGTTCSGGVCNGAAPALCEVCVDSGNATDTGCSALTPHCIGNSGARSCVACTSAAHCDDSVLCTDDSCESNACVNTSVAAGDAGSCAGGLVCSGTPTDLCVTCSNTDPANMSTDAGCSAGAPFCAAVGGGSVVTCESCVDAGTGTDPGCDGAAPNCVVGAGGSNECVSCLSAADCSDGNECTTDVCASGICTNPGLTEFTPCATGVCTAASMCAAAAVVIDAPADRAVTANNTPTVSGTGTPGGTVELRLNGTLVATVTVSALGAWSHTVTTPLADGDVGVEADLTAGAATANDTTAFIVDTMTVVTIETPANGSTSLDSTPLIVGTGEPGASVDVSFDGNALGTVTVALDGSWMIAVTTPAINGSHTVSAVATDAVGNMANTSSTFDIGADTDVDIEAPANGTVTSDNTPTISGTALPGASVTLTTVIDSVVVTLGTVVADGSGNWSLDVTSPLDDATYVVTATATDLANNMAEDMSSFTVDTMTFVTIETIDPTSGVVTGTGEPGATVVVLVDNIELGSALVGSDGSWTFTAGALDVGQRTIVANATDVAGNTASDSDVVVVAATDAGLPDAGVGADGGGLASSAGGLSGGALCATRAPVGASWPGAAGLLLVGLGLAVRRRRR
jgi:cysteine-rich repeat protein